MSKLEEMWVALTAYQPQADADGHGESWAAMCKERTVDAAFAAAAYAAAFAAADAAREAAHAAAAEQWAQRAIDKLKGQAKQPAQCLPDAITDKSEHPEYISGWNECREAMKGMMK